MDLEPEVLEELRSTFRVEFDDELQAVTQSLLKLEKSLEGKERQELLDGVFRSVHTIKGASRCVNIDDVMEIAHQLESLFSTLRQQNSTPSQAAIDLCLEAAERMREAFDACEKEKPLEFDLAELLGRIEAGSTICAGNEATAKQATPATAETGSTKDHQASAKEAAPARQQDSTGEREASPPAMDEATVEGETTEETDRPGSAPPVGKAVPATAKESSEMIRVMVDRVERLGSLAEELQMAKLELDDQFANVERLRGGMEELMKLWKPRSSAYKGDGGEQSSGAVRRLVSRGSDLISGCNKDLTRVQKNMRGTLSRLGILSGSLGTDVRLLRLVSAGTVLRPLALGVRGIARELGKKVNLEITGDDVQMDRSVLQGLRDPLMHLLRNAIDHGIETPEKRLESGKSETGSLAMNLRREGNEIEITVEDDGAGISAQRVGRVALRKRLVSPTALEILSEKELLDLIFCPGLSTRDVVTHLSGRGVGLDVVRANLRELKGRTRVESTVGGGTCFTLRVPLTLAAERGLLVRTGGQLFAIPITAASRILNVAAEDVIEVEASQAVRVGDRVIPLRDMAAALDVRADDVNLLSSKVAVVVSKGWQQVALLVDEVVGEREIVVKPLRSPLVSVRNVSGGTLTGGGEIIMVLNPTHLIDSALDVALPAVDRVRGAEEDQKAPPHILVVDDSITTRTLEKTILENKGYEVTVAVNGREAWDLLQTQEFDLVLSDIEMPIMNGLELTKRIKEGSQSCDIPVVIVSSRADEIEKQRGIDVGADAFIVKGAFETTALLEVVEQLV